MAKKGPHAFSRERRLRKRADFLRIQSNGRRVTTPHFVLLVASTPAQVAEPGPVTDSAQLTEPSGRQRFPPAVREPARLGIVVTRKLGNAVARNRVKRLCRECFRQLPDLLPTGVDLVVIGRQGADGLGLAQVMAEWSTAAPRLRRCAQEALAQAGARTHVSGSRGGGRGSAAAPDPTPKPGKPPPRLEE